MSDIMTASSKNRTQANMLGASYEELLGGLTYQLTWERFKKIVKRYGFKIGYQRTFNGHGWRDKDEKILEEEIIFFNEKNGLILYANSFNSTAINQATLYGEVNCENSFSGEQKAILTHCRTLQKSGKGLAFSMEVGKGFKHYVEKLEKFFEFNNPWQTKREGIVMANYMEREQMRKPSWQNKTSDKLNACSSELRMIMCV